MKEEAGGGGGYPLFLSLINCGEGNCFESYLMVWTASLPGSDDCSIAHESCCNRTRSPAEHHMGGVRWALSSSTAASSMVWRCFRGFAGSKPSIRDDSIVITAVESRCLAVHTLYPPKPCSISFVKHLVERLTLFFIPSSTCIIIFTRPSSSLPILRFGCLCSNVCPLF